MLKKYPPATAESSKSVLGAEFLSRERIRSFLDCAFHFKRLEEASKPLPTSLMGKTVILLFFEASTRTRGSFEIASKRLGGTTLVLTKQMSSTEKGETLIDTARTIEAMRPDVLILRHPSAGSPNHLDAILGVPIINAGDGFHEHPTQALLDLMTLEELKGKLEGLKVLIVGDIAHSRVARSDIYALKTMGAKVSVCAPPTLMPPKVENLGVQVFFDLEKAVRDQDVVMMLRIQMERLTAGQLPSKGEYARFYGMNRELLSRCKKDVAIMHPGPVNRGVELAPDVADGPHSIILNQVANGVLMRMAVLHLLTGGQPPPAGPSTGGGR